eukprot:314002-Hanusia_phi.AAC.3
MLERGRGWEGGRGGEIAGRRQEAETRRRRQETGEGVGMAGGRQQEAGGRRQERGKGMRSGGIKEYGERGEEGGGVVVKRTTDDEDEGEGDGDCLQEDFRSFDLPVPCPGETSTTSLPLVCLLFVSISRNCPNLPPLLAPPLPPLLDFIICAGCFHAGGSYGHDQLLELFTLLPLSLIHSFVVSAFLAFYCKKHFLRIAILVLALLTLHETMRPIARDRNLVGEGDIVEKYGATLSLCKNVSTQHWFEDPSRPGALHAFVRSDSQPMLKISVILP